MLNHDKNQVKTAEGMFRIYYSRRRNYKFPFHFSNRAKETEYRSREMCSSWLIMSTRTRSTTSHLDSSRLSDKLTHLAIYLLPLNQSPIVCNQLTTDDPSIYLSISPTFLLLLLPLRLHCQLYKSLLRSTPLLFWPRVTIWTIIEWRKRTLRWCNYTDHPQSWNKCPMITANGHHGYSINGTVNVWSEDL